MPRPINPQAAARLHSISSEIAPKLAEVAAILRENDLHEFEIGVSNTDSFFWSGGLANKKAPSEQEVQDDILAILNIEYPKGVRTFMGMVYNPNLQVAQGLAKIVGLHRAKDRREVQGQLIALLAAFQQGS